MAVLSTDIYEAIEVLLHDDIIGLPTETVYGLAANIFSDKAIQKIFSIKKRPAHNPLIVHLFSIDQLSLVAKNIPETAYMIAKKF